MVLAYDGSCELVLDKYQGRRIAKVVQLDPEIEEMQLGNIFYNVAESNENHPAWIYVEEWGLYRSNISNGVINKKLW